MKAILASCLLIIAAVAPSAFAQSTSSTSSTNVVATVSLGWDANPPHEEVTSYRVFFGQSADLWTHAKDVPGGSTTEASVPLTGYGVWFFTVAARNSAGILSAPAPVVSYEVKPGPGTPGKFRIVGAIRSTHIQTSETLILVP